MPIGNTYLSEYHLASVNYPEVGILPASPTYETTLTEGTAISSASPVFPLIFSTQSIDPPSVQVNVAFRSFSRTVSRPIIQQSLIQGWPLGKISDMQMATYTYQIDVPVILLPHTTSGPGKYRIRALELEFFSAWFSYAASAMDRITWPDGSTWSVVVEKLSVQVSPDDISLQMTIKSNADIGWNLIRDKDNIVMGRTARGYDTFMGWKNTSGGLTPSPLPAWGWQDRFGISSFSMNLSSETEEISATNHLLLKASGTKPAVYNTGHSPDMLNCQLVKYGGGLSVFGLTEQNTPDIRKSIQFQTSNEYNTQFGNDGVTIPTSPTIDEDVFDINMTSGGMYVVIGASNGIVPGTVVGQPFVFIPTGTLISKASTEATGGTVKLNREFSGVTSHIPYVPNTSGGVAFSSIIR